MNDEFSQTSGKILPFFCTTLKVLFHLNMPSKSEETLAIATASRDILS